ncbi:MAG: PAS domain S-box protein [Limisphaerales bacterium]
MKIRFRDSLLFQVGLSVVLIQSLALLGVALVFKGLFDNELRREITSHLEIPAQLMARGELDAEAIANLPAMEQILGEKLAIGAIVDDTGLIYRSLNTNDVGGNLITNGLVSARHFEEALKNGEVASFPDGDNNALLSVLPITQARGYAPDRYLALKIRTAQLDERGEQLLFWSALAAIGLFGVTTLLLVAMYRRHMEQPMTDLLNAVRRLEDGDFSARIPERGSRDELQHLAEGINRMATKLEHSDLRIETTERKFAALLDQAADAIFLHDVDGRFIEVNEQACRQLGYDRETLLKMTVPDFVVGRPKRETRRVLEQLEPGKPVELESLHRNSSGQTIPVEVRATATMLGGRKMVLSIVRDITERRRATDAINHSRLQLQLITDNLPSLIAYIDRGERYKFVNRAYANYYERFDKEIMGRLVRDVIGEVDYRNAEPYIRGVLGGRMEVFQVTRTDSEHRLHHFLGSYIPHEEDGEVLGFFALIHEITELQEANEALRLSEARYRQLVDGSPYAIHEIDETGRLRSMNPAGLRMLNFKQEDQALGMEFVDIVSHADRERVKHHVVAALSDEATEFDFVTAQGQEFATSLVPFADAEGRLAGLVGITRDVTEAKKAENRLRFTQFTVDQARLAIFWCHPDGMFYYVNETACHWLQYTREELAGMHVADINPEFPRSAWEDHWNEIKNEGLQVMESVHQRKDGTTYPVEIHSNYVKVEDQEFKLAFVFDISVQQESEARYRALFDKSADAIFLVAAEGDDIGRIISANAAAGEMHGYTVDELIGREIHELHTEESEALSRKRVATLLAKGSMHFEVEHLHRDGTVIPMEVNANIVTFKDRRFILAIDRDITQRRQDELIRQQAEEEVKQHLASVQALTEGLETVREEERKRISREIHDELGQMLTVLKMNLHGMEKQIVSITEAKIRNPLEERVVEADALTEDTIKAVREIALRVRPSVLDQLGLLSAIRQECGLFSERAGLDCNIVTDDALPDLDDRVNTTLFRLCQEFLTNVARHANASRVTVELHQVNGEVRLQVKDNGQGFDPQTAERKGHLGLVGARERVNNLHGELTISSVPESGTSITVRIPTAASSTEEQT